MSPINSVYKKIASALEHNGGENIQSNESPEKSNPAHQISRDLAHDLNNILAIIQGYSERLLIRHGKDATLAPHLKVISEASKRATAIIRDVTPPSGGAGFGQPQNQSPA